ncbi:MAG: hypothetical protein A2901_08325 [Elusimicrobia bacterium RIFCSPLOWO2_01_FULL_54_10]|nr:MAG: hypothetical protein A2901_08325 [Elusimicrobia bacterium RIFCSPLOWO2_01_FULL_54_10]
MVFMKEALLLIFGIVAAAQAQPLINEVASEEAPATGDWIELYVASAPADLSGWKIYEQNTLIKTFPSNSIFSADTYLILHFNSSAPDETPDFYTPDTGLTGTSNVLTLRNAEGLIADAVVFSDSSSWTSAQQSAFNLAVASGQWTGTPDAGTRSFLESVNIAGGIGAGNSIGRVPGSADNNHFLDWSHYKGKQTPGTQNPAVITCQTTRHPEGTISEIAPSLPLSTGGDFVEIFVRERADVCGLKLREGENIIKIFPPVTPNAGPFGEFVVLHASIRVSLENPDETDATGDLNGNGVIDLYSDESSPGITGSSDNSVSLESSEGRVMDFIGFADRLPLFGQDYYAVYDRAAAEGVWSPVCAGEEDCYAAGSVVWANSSTKSMSKKAKQAGLPRTERPSTALDWEISPPSPGKVLDPAQNAPGRAKKPIAVTQSPFSPVKGGRFREARIHCSADESSRVSMRIFDSRGRLVLTLAERLSCFPESVLPWNGRGADGAWVPAGIYIVWAEIKGSGSDVQRTAETVVVGTMP